MFSILAAPEGLSTLTSILAIGIAVVFHEVSHGYVANWLGDPTAKYAGRLSLNPIKHIDLWGTIIIPGILLLTHAGVLFGWAKPVPVNYYNLKYGKYGPLIVALAGPASNFLILLICGALIRISPEATSLPYLFVMIGLVNTFLMLFNLLPIPPLDGSKILFIFLEKRPDIVAAVERYGMFLLFGIIILFPGFISQFVFLPALFITSFVMGVSIPNLISLL
ncbi:MAG: site-2 protease family protein [Patescibacteria group bacterium]